MSEVIGPGGEGTWGLADMVLDGHARDLAEKVYAATRGRVATRSQAEVNVLVANVKNSVNNWSQRILNGVNEPTTESAGPGSQDPVGAGKGDVSIPLLVQRWAEDLAVKVYARLRARDVTWSWAEVNVLVTDIVNAVNAWLAAGGATVETAGPVGMNPIL
jgi:hypothetical protein